MSRRLRPSLAAALAPALALCTLAGSCGSDPCDGQSGSCLTIEARGAISGIARLQVDLAGSAEFRVTKDMPAGVSTLPVQLGVLLPEVTGLVTVRVVALGAAGPVGAGSQNVDVTAGARVLAAVSLAALTAATCSDGFRDGDESDTDCGGSCGPCRPGQFCNVNKDCGDDRCDESGKCVAATCSDGKTNGTETDSDCGGGKCDACIDGKACKANGDCKSGVCAGKVCAAAACADGVKNGSEADIDCGGSCAPCGAGRSCGKPADCTSGRCEGGKCLGLTLALAAPFAEHLSGNPTSSLAGDLNGDGFPDLVTCANSGVLTVIVSRAAFAYASPAAYQAGAPGLVPRAIAAADFNNDTKLDVVVLNQVPSAATLSVFFGRGDGTLGPPLGVPLSGGTSAGGMAVGDFNNDNLPDVAVTQSAGAIELRLSDGKGGFAAGQPIMASPTLLGIAAGDWNNDKHDDIAVTAFVPMMLQPNRLLLFLSDGGSKFSAGAVLTLAASYPQLSAFDVDGDRDKDLVGTGPNVLVLPGRPRTMNLFDTPVAVPTPIAPLTVAGGGDWNGDGNLDLLVSQPGALNFLVAPGRGGGVAFAAPITVPLGAPGSTALSADLDGDKKLDLALSAGSQLLLFANDPAGSYPLARTVPIASLGQPRNVTLADVNGDKKLDALVAGSKGLGVHLGGGDGSLGAGTVEMVGMNLVALVAQDLNGDGKVDVATIPQPGNNVVVALGKGDGTFDPPTSLPVGNSPQMLAAGDLNGDGRPDLAVANLNSSDVSVLRAGNSGFGAATNIGVGGNASGVTIADVNGDGKLDLVVGNATANSLVILPGNGDGAFLTPTSVAVGARPAGIVTADFNGDGRIDLASSNLNSSNVSVVLATGGGQFLAAINHVVPGQASTLAVADLNLDGRPDLVSGSLGLSHIGVLVGSGDASVFRPALHLGTGNLPAVATGDLNGDGKPDIVTSNASSTSLSIILNSSR